VNTPAWPTQEIFAASEGTMLQKKIMHAKSAVIRRIILFVPHAGSRQPAAKIPFNRCDSLAEAGLPKVKR
jgi:hypothetical protein